MDKSIENIKQTLRSNALGEIAVEQSPHVQLENTRAVPQQFLIYKRDINSVENILGQIRCDENYLLFTKQHADFIYIQVGIIGRENYPPSDCERDDKIVYGRPWLVEKNMPTSEIIQTAFLAIKKAREHELREYFVLRLQDNDGNYIGKCTPFNSHIDLPLLCKEMNTNVNTEQQDPNINQSSSNSVDDNTNESTQALETILERTSFANYTFHLQKTHHINNAMHLVEITIETDKGLSKAAQQIAAHFPEMANTTLYLQLEELTPNALLHALISKLIEKSDEYIAENFTFNGFARFSKKINAQAIGEFSRNTRVISEVQRTDKFEDSLSQMIYEVDSARAPALNKNELGKFQLETLNQYDAMEGYLPINFQT